MRKLLLASAFLLPSIIFTCSAMADPLVQQSAPSAISIAKEGENFRVVNDSQRFQTNIFSPTAGSGMSPYQLLEIRQHKVAVEGPQVERNLEESTAKVTVYPLSNKGKGEAAFTIQGKADEVDVEGAFLIFMRYPCCVEIPTRAVYSLENGKYLFNTTMDEPSGNWISMNARDSSEFGRIFAYHTKITAADGELFGGEKNGAVILTYAKRNEPLQRVMLVATQADTDRHAVLEWIPKIDFLSSAYSNGSDYIFIDRQGKPEDIFTNVTLRLTLDKAMVVEIPLVADKLDIKAAKLPKGYSLKEMKL